MTKSVKRRKSTKRKEILTEKVTGSLTERGTGKIPDDIETLKRILDAIGIELLVYDKHTGFPRFKMYRIIHHRHYYENANKIGRIERFVYESNKDKNDMVVLYEKMKYVYGDKDNKLLSETKMKNKVTNYFHEYAKVIDPYASKMEWVIKQAKAMRPYWESWKESGFSENEMMLNGEKIPIVQKSLDDIFLLDDSLNEPELVEFGSVLMYAQIMDSFLTFYENGEHKWRSDNILTLADSNKGNMGKGRFGRILAEYLEKIGNHDEEFMKELGDINNIPLRWFKSLSGLNFPNGDIDKEQVLLLAYKLVVELSEKPFDLNREIRKNHNNFKTWLTDEYDMSRLFFDQNTFPVPRLYGIYLSSNSRNPIPKDDTPNRRFVVNYIKGSILDKMNEKMNNDKNNEEYIDTELSNYFGRIYEFPFDDRESIRLTTVELFLVQTYLGLKDNTFNLHRNEDIDHAIIRMNKIATYNDDYDDDLEQEERIKYKICYYLMLRRNTGAQPDLILKNIKRFDKIVKYYELQDEFDREDESENHIDTKRLNELLDMLVKEGIIVYEKLPEHKRDNPTRKAGYRYSTKKLNLPKANNEPNNAKWDKIVLNWINRHFKKNQDNEPV